MLAVEVSEAAGNECELKDVVEEPDKLLADIPELDDGLIDGAEDSEGGRVDDWALEMELGEAPFVDKEGVELICTDELPVAATVTLADDAGDASVDEPPDVTALEPERTLNGLCVGTTTAPEEPMLASSVVAVLRTAVEVGVVCREYSWLLTGSWELLAKY